jgi:hypothetical protein
MIIKLNHINKKDILKHDKDCLHSHKDIKLEKKNIELRNKHIEVLKIKLEYPEKIHIYYETYIHGLLCKIC